MNLDLFESLPDKEKEEYFLKIKDKLGKGDLLNTFIIDLPANIRIKYIDLLDYNKYYNKEKLISGITDEKIVYEILVNALKNTKYESDYIFKLVPYQYKEQFLSEIKKKEELNQEEIISSYCIENYLKEFNVEDRYHILVDIIFKDFLYKYEKINTVTKNMIMKKYLNVFHKIIKNLKNLQCLKY